MTYMLIVLLYPYQFEVMVDSPNLHKAFFFISILLSFVLSFCLFNETNETV